MSELATLVRTRLRSPAVLLWIAPVVVWLIVSRQLRIPFLSVHLFLAVTIAALGLAAASRSATISMRLLYGFLPFSNLVLAYAYNNGIPGQIVRQSGFWKELLVAAVGLAALRCANAEPRRLDKVDRLVVAYVAVLTVFLVVPPLLVVSGPGLDVDFSTRLAGFRTDATYVLLFGAARHVRLPGAQVAKVVKTFLTALVVVAALAIFEFVFTERWREVLLVDVDLARFQLEVLDARPERVGQMLLRLRNRVSHALPRVGSTEIQPVALAFPLVVALAYSVESLVQGRLRGRIALGAGVIAVALLMTQTRSAIGAAAIVLALSIRAMPGRSPLHRVRAQSILAIGLALVLPLAIAGGLTGRFGGDETSDASHEFSLFNGLDTMLENPLGTGMSTGSGAAQAIGVEGRVNSENQYLQIGTQYGVAVMLLYAVLIISVIRLLRQRADQTEDPDALVALLGSRAALIGIAFASLIIQPYLGFLPAWSVWGIAGLALGAAERTEPRQVDADAA